jgi:hypothetical protein
MTEGRQFHKPLMMDPAAADQLPGGIDPAEQSEIAHATAQALVARARNEAPNDPDLVQRLLSLIDEEGVETIARLWGNAPADSLPGALFRVYMLRQWVRNDPDGVSERYKLGASQQPVALVVAGAALPPGPREMIELADVVLSGMFTAKLDVALERAAAFARILTTGSALDADWLEENHPEEAQLLTQRASKLLHTAEALESAASKWRQGKLE